MGAAVGLGAGPGEARGGGGGWGGLRGPGGAGSRRIGSRSSPLHRWGLGVHRRGVWRAGSGRKAQGLTASKRGVCLETSGARRSLGEGPRAGSGAIGGAAADPRSVWRRTAAETPLWLQRGRHLEGWMGNLGPGRRDPSGLRQRYEVGTPAPRAVAGAGVSLMTPQVQTPPRLMCGSTQRAAGEVTARTRANRRKSSRRACLVRRGRAAAGAGSRYGAAVHGNRTWLPQRITSLSRAPQSAALMGTRSGSGAAENAKTGLARVPERCFGRLPRSRKTGGSVPEERATRKCLVQQIAFLSLISTLVLLRRHGWYCYGGMAKNVLPIKQS